jgi:hypothetical protein
MDNQLKCHLVIKTQCISFKRVLKKKLRRAAEKKQTLAPFSRFSIWWQYVVRDEIYDKPNFSLLDFCFFSYYIYLSSFPRERFLLHSQKQQFE